MGTMAYDIRHDRKPVICISDPDGGVYICVSYYVCVQHLGGNEGGRRGDCAMQKLFVSEVQKRIVRISVVSVYRGGDFCNNEKLRR